MLYMDVRRLLFVVISLVSSNCLSDVIYDPEFSNLDQHKAYSSWQGIEPDKWATIWLIKRYVSRDAYFLFVLPNSPLPDNSVAFDVPEASIRRSKGHSMFGNLLEERSINSQSLRYIEKIIYDIEVNIWEAPEHPHSIWFETMFRKLQARYNRDQVPVDCYLKFFDEVERLSLISSVTSFEYQDGLSLKEHCPGIKESGDEFVRQIGHVEILRQIGLGKNIVFIDTREDDEFAEVRIPGAKLLRLREVSEETVKPYKEVDLVVPYCVKDFRGFEVAKSMKFLGVNHVATLSPNGLKGWIGAGLPVAKTNGAPDGQAIEKLYQCAMSPHACLEGCPN